MDETAKQNILVITKKIIEISHNLTHSYEFKLEHR